MGESASSAPVKVLGRYALHGEIASGGMASVHFGRLVGPVGFSRTVAIKRLRPQFAEDPEFVSMFLDEARLAARVQHPHVVPTLDVVAMDGELFLVMEYVPGESLARLIRASRTRGELIPPPIVCAVMVAVLHGLHAAHEAKNERGEPLNLVHRDVSPHNVLVGADGVARVLDFGVAKAAGRVQTTREGQVKGKVAYMAPEQVRGEATRQSDVYAAAVVLWEALTTRRLFEGEHEGVTLARVLAGTVTPPSKHAPGLPAELDEVTLRGLARDLGGRYKTAREMARALERIGPLAPTSDVGEWVELLAGSALAQRAALLAGIESRSAPAAQPSRRSDPRASNSGVSAVSGVKVGGGAWAPGPGVAADGAALAVADAVPVGAPRASVSEVRVSTPSPPDSEMMPTESSAVLTAQKLAAGEAQGKNRRLAPAMLAALIGVGLLAWGAVALKHLKSGTAGASAGPAVSESSSAAPGATVDETGSANATATAAAAGTVTATASGDNEVASPAGSVGGVKGTVTGGNARGATTAKGLPPAPARPNCNPPFTVDANGDRHYKRECLGR